MNKENHFSRAENWQLKMDKERKKTEYIQACILKCREYYHLIRIWDIHCVYENNAWITSNKKYEINHGVCGRVQKELHTFLHLGNKFINCLRIETIKTCTSCKTCVF